MRSRNCAEHHIVHFDFRLARERTWVQFTHCPSGLPRRLSNTKIEDSCGCLWSSSAGLRLKFGQVGSVWSCLFTSLSSHTCVDKMAERSRDRSSSAESSPSFSGVLISEGETTTIFAASNAARMKGNHFVLKTDPVSFAKIGCPRRELLKPRPTLRRHDARPQLRRRRRRKPANERPWTTP